MNTRVLISGGAGFIGTRLANRLRRSGAEIAVVDSLLPQVHGNRADPIGLDAGIDLHRIDIVDRRAIDKLIDAFDPHTCVHLAAETGTGQSMDEVVRYCQTNVTGTAHLLESLSAPTRSINRIVLASSRAVYGEGKYVTAAGATVVPEQRTVEQMRSGRFEICRSSEGDLIHAMPTTEDTPANPVSVYGSTKLMQEQLVRQIASTRGWKAVVLRFQNVYGDGQSLRNPYTGVLSIFVSQLLAGRTLNIFEDGVITRDFVYVDDVVRALELALVSRISDAPVNIGSGEPVAIIDVARRLIDILNLPKHKLEVTGDFRPGDIRYALADIGRAESALSWRPSTSLSDGLNRLVEWSLPTSSGTAR